MKYKHRDKLVADLRELADFIEERGLNLPLDMGYNKVTLAQRFYDESKERMIRAAKGMGSVQKRYRLGDLELVKLMRNSMVELRFETSQENVCIKRVVGTKLEPRTVVTVVPDEFIEREIVEWDCVPILAPAVTNG